MNKKKETKGERMCRQVGEKRKKHREINRDKGTKKKTMKQTFK